jgi:type II secretory ATPase GspE/PulE/Tfp pilus assembly ATPase PilB-like protein
MSVTTVRQQTGSTSHDHGAVRPEPEGEPSVSAEDSLDQETIRIDEAPKPKNPSSGLGDLTARLSALKASVREVLEQPEEPEPPRLPRAASPSAVAPSPAAPAAPALSAPPAPAAPSAASAAPTTTASPSPFTGLSGPGVAGVSISHPPTGPATTSGKPEPLGKRRVGRFDYLLAQRFIEREQLDAAIAEGKQRQVSPESVLMEKFGIRKADLATSLMLFHRRPFVALEKGFAPPAEILAGLSLARLKAACWLPIRHHENTVTVLVDDPNDLPRVDSIERTLQGYEVHLAVGIRDNILEAIAAIASGSEVGGQGGGVATILSDVTEKDGAEETDDLHRAEVSESDSVVVRLANQVVIDAARGRASDIHIEPAGPRRELSIRFRVDGSCIPYQQIPSSLRNALVARFKIMAGLDIAERRKPQDGKIRIALGEQNMELRVATVPTVGGNEDVVLRILAAQGALALNDLGLTPRNLEELQSAATKPYGLILCVGPTGSGKTTTLHAVLGHINTPERKIWTAEDPVEITQHGLRQVQVRPQIGYSFATAMRAFLRADPDVIMVGEMRDKETAATGVEASLTGHLVLSTLHTNSAVETVVRLLDLGIDPFNFADALVAVIAQRLVKRTCKECRVPYSVSEAEFAELARPFGGAEPLAALGHRRTDQMQLWRGKGCDQCNGTGYRGRAAIHELMVASDEIKQLIQARARVPELLAQACKDGMTTLVQDGVLKVLGGMTDYGQVRAVAIR